MIRPGSRKPCAEISRKSCFNTVAYRSRSRREPARRHSMLHRRSGGIPGAYNGLPRARPDIAITMLRRFWLLFAQVATVCVAALFVVATLRPDLLARVAGK